MRPRVTTDLANMVFNMTTQAGQAPPTTQSQVVQKLIRALIENGLPTAEEITKAMELAYEAGKIDGSLATCEKLLAKQTT